MHARVAQWLERCFHKAQVVGSIPTSGTKEIGVIVIEILLLREDLFKN